MSRSQFVLIILIILIGLLLPYGLKSAEPDKASFKIKSEPVYIVPEG